VTFEEGELVAKSTGNLWFWRNLAETDVTVVLQSRSSHSEIKRVT
jgi:hypothetical protein